ncbi:helix-turn-helix domain-containing protein [Streptomyces sp. NBC_01136]|uniref:AraC-like ligand-binding domain-containing protein n=1 Tax=unclassified Streptomyces TaxID=2593676 RepID=UPI00324D993E|nr:helix-turn-helix domain-containing protein [Streptomyces sp. NBC_01136]
MWQGGSATAVAASERFDWFTDVVANALMPTALRADDTAGFHAEGSVLALGNVQVSRFSYSPLRSRRTPKLIRRGDPEQYQLGLVTKGSMWISQRGGESGLLSGDMVLWDTSRPSEAGSGVEGRMVEAFVLQIPKSEVSLRANQVDQLLARRIPAGTGMGAILAQFLTALPGNGPDCRPQDLSRLGATAVDLAVACLAHHLGAPQHVPTEARVHAMFRRIDDFIDCNLDDPELTPSVIADRHHISLRSLYALFEGRPESVAASIRQRRLERCRADLADPELRKESVQAVAARWGFTSATVFSRTFRAAYGTTPTQYRHEFLDCL